MTDLQYIAAIILNLELESYTLYNFSSSFFVNNTNFDNKKMTEKEKDVNKEHELAQQLKDNYCDETGKETDTAKAADIIHQIGLIYRKRSPDKMSLIKSVGLFNAAIVRNPLNVTKVKLDLSEICQHILSLADASTANLVKKAENVKMSVNQLRKDVKNFLKKSLPKISSNVSPEKFQDFVKNKIVAVKRINKTIAKKYTKIMIDLCKFCENVMGKPPCDYAVVGMGSLAREEITPFSDFEHIILLHDDENYQVHLEYFRWFSTIFHVIVLNVQETIIPSLNVKSLNDKKSQLKDWYYDVITPRGISFDGMMPHACKFPLGRQQHTNDKKFTTELIKPVSEMLEYLSSEADLKNGYHLADILTKTCFVFGNDDIFKQFENGVINFRSKKSKEENISDVIEQVKSDLTSFSIRSRLSKLKSNDKINIKHLVYRSVTIFIIALARINNINKNSCFDIIESMAVQSKITKNTAHKLQFSVAIACEIRLRVYMEKNSQCDNVFDLKQDGIEKFLDVVGVASTFNYFQIAYCLQCDVAKQLKFTKLYFYSDPILINLAMYLLFGINTDLSRILENLNPQIWPLTAFDFDKCINTLETQSNLILLQTKNQKSSFGQNDLSADHVLKIANYLKSEKLFDEALEFYKNLLEIYKNHPKVNYDSVEVASTKDEIGFCLNKLRRLEEAWKFLNQSLEIKEKITVNASRDWRIAGTLQNLGDYNIKLGNFKAGLECLNRALVIKQNITTEAKKDKNISASIHTIGYCYKKLCNYSEALKHFHQALEIKSNITHDYEKDRSIASTLHEIGYCHWKLKNYDKALKFLYKALEIEQNATKNAENEKSIALKYHTIGVVHISLKKYNKALEYLKRELTIRKNTTLELEIDRSIGQTYHYLGVCYFWLNDNKMALTLLYQALKIRENINCSEKDYNNDIAQTLQAIHRCKFAASLQEICRCPFE